MMNFKENVHRRHARKRIEASDTEKDDEWRKLLQGSSIPETQLKVASFRKAGCMLHFVVAQTSISLAAAETLGQLVFPEYFPVDGLGILEPPIPSIWSMPRWVCFLVVILVVSFCLTANTLFFTVEALF